MNLKDLEIDKVNKVDGYIEELFSQRQAMVECRSKEHQAYYKIKDYIERSRYSLSVQTVLYGAKFVLKGESYSCSVDSVVRDCKAACKMLLDAGYGV